MCRRERPDPDRRGSPSPAPRPPERADGREREAVLTVQCVKVLAVVLHQLALKATRQLQAVYKRLPWIMVPWVAITLEVSLSVLAVAWIVKPARMIISDTLTYGDVLGALERVTRAVGRKVNPTVYTAAEFSKRARTENAFVTRVLEQPKLWVIGSDDGLPVAA